MTTAAADRFGLRPTAGHLRTVLGCAALAAAYYSSARLGFALEFSGPIGAIIWLPAGVGMAFLYLGGLRLWPGVLLGELLVNNYTSLPVRVDIGQTVGNLLEVVVAVAVLRRLMRDQRPLDSVRGVVATIVAIVAGTSVSATIGLGSFVGTEGIHWDEVPTLWRTWFLGDSIGGLLVLPLALAWHERPSRDWLRRRGAETAFLVLAVTGLTTLALNPGGSLTYVVYPALAWAALRLGQRGATAAVATTAVLAVWRTTRYAGAFNSRSIDRTVLTTQLYIAVAALSTFVLAAVVSERESLAAEVRRSRSRLIEAADAERRRIERDIHDGAQQRLTALAYKLRRVGEEARASSAHTADLVEDAESDLELAIDELRELAHGIRPTVLTDLGLANALRSIAARSVLPVRLHSLPADRVDGPAEATAYYVVAEAVANAQKYARATAVDVSVSLSSNDLSVEIADDGIGGAVAGLGLQGLRDRVEAADGRFEVVSVRGCGTRVTATIPT